MILILILFGNSREGSQYRIESDDGLAVLSFPKVMV